jgi:hypothetical protein
MKWFFFCKQTKKITRIFNLNPMTFIFSFFSTSNLCVMFTINIQTITIFMKPDADVTAKIEETNEKKKNVLFIH